MRFQFPKAGLFVGPLGAFAISLIRSPILDKRAFTKSDYLKYRPLSEQRERGDQKSLRRRAGIEVPDRGAKRISMPFKNAWRLTNPTPNTIQGASVVGDGSYVKPKC